MNPRFRSLVLPVLATAIVVAAVLKAIVILGGPGAQRQRKMDEVRVQNLMLIQSTLGGYFRRHKELPADLLVLAKEPGYRIVRLDPDTGHAYDYQMLGGTAYRLCADFSTDSATDPDPRPAYPNLNANPIWAHGRGHQCFDRDADPQKATD